MGNASTSVYPKSGGVVAGNATGGTSGAAAYPAKHGNLADAEKEATRLAKKTPGEEFVIYETRKAFKVEEKPVTVKSYY